jgi:membrane protease YdiL (CAAX protease family)
MTSVPPPTAAGHPVPPERPERPEGLPEPPRRGPERWTPWSAPAALVAGLGATLVVSFLLLGIALALGGGSAEHPPGWVNVAGLVVQDSLFAGSAVLFASMAVRARPWHFGLRPPASLKRAAGLTVLAFGVFIVFSALWLLLVGSDDHQDIGKELGVGHGTAAIAAVTVLVTVGAPLAEELFFRGFFFAAIRNWRGPWPAAIITGLVFGGAHALGSPVAYLLPLAVLGVALCLLYQWTGSLYPGMVLHCINNAIALGGAEHWSWQIPLVAAGALAAIAAVLAIVQRVAGPEPAGQLAG